MSSTILRRLSPEETISITNEILDAPDQWWREHVDTDHYRLYGALRGGRTIYLRKQERYEVTDAWNHFATVRNIVEEYSSNYSIGKCYLHRLLPGQIISPHNDLSTSATEQIQKRIQIYINIETGVEIILDGAVFNVSELQNTILDFDLKLNHAYYNNSVAPLYLFVFDLRPPC